MTARKPISEKVFAVVIVVLTCISIGVFTLYKRAKEHQDRSANSWVEFLRMLKETNTGLIKVRSGDNWIFWASHEAEGIFGYGEDEMSGLPLARIMPEKFVYDHEKKMLSSMEKAKHKQIPIRLIPVSCQGLTKDGKTFDVVLRIMIGDDSVMVLVNRASETRFMPIDLTPNHTHEKPQSVQ